MQGTIVTIKELAREQRVGKSAAVEECREREVQVLWDEQFGEELQEFCARLNVAVGGRM